MSDDFWQAFLRLSFVLFTLAGAVLIAVVFIVVFDGYALVNRLFRLT